MNFRWMKVAYISLPKGLENGSKSVKSQGILKRILSGNTRTVNLVIFVRILFSQAALNDIFVTLKSRDWSMIYLHQSTAE